MSQFIAITPSRCIGCGTCQSDCSAAHAAVGLQSEPRISVIETYEVSAAVTCHHCEGAPCMAVCPVNAITKDPRDFIHVNEQTCIGCKLCALACPFGAIHPSGTSTAGVAGIRYATPTYPKSLDPILRYDEGVYLRAVKCDLCNFDPEGPHCVRACPTDALRLVDSRASLREGNGKRQAAIVAANDIRESLSSIRKEKNEL